MSGHTYTHTYTQDNYSNPRCACTPKVNKGREGGREGGLKQYFHRGYHQIGHVHQATCRAKQAIAKNNN